MLYNDGSEVVDVDVSAAAFKRIVDEQFGGDLERVVRLYYGRLRRMLELGGFDIVGHADKMHYNAACYRPGLLDEVWYDTLVKEFFEDIAARSYQVEINTKSYHDLGTFYPNERYFPLLHSLGIRVQVNSDSHYPERINSGRPEALRALVKAGYKTVMELYDGKWPGNADSLIKVIYGQKIVCLKGMCENGIPLSLCHSEQSGSRDSHFPASF